MSVRRGASHGDLGDANLTLGILLDDVQSEVAQCRHVLRRVARPMTCIVFAKRNVEHPMQLALYAPMAADCAANVCDVYVRFTADVVRRLRGCLLGRKHGALPNDLHHKRQARPAVRRCQPAEVATQLDRPRLHPVVALVHLFARLDGGALKLVAGAPPAIRRPQCAYPAS